MKWPSSINSSKVPSVVCLGALGVNTLWIKRSGFACWLNLLLIYHHLEHYIMELQVFVCESKASLYIYIYLYQSFYGNAM